MSVDLGQMEQLSLFEQVAWRTTVQIEPHLYPLLDVKQNYSRGKNIAAIDDKCT